MKEIHPEAIERLLIRGTNWVGDSVMSVPAMREIRRIFPRARISLLVRPWVRDVYAGADFIDEILEFDKTQTHRGVPGLLRLASELRQRKFEVAILLQNAIEAAILSWLAQIPVRIGYARDGRGVILTHHCRIDPEVLRMHQAYYYLDVLTAARLLDGRPWLRSDYRLSIDLAVRAADQAAAGQMLRDQGVEPGQTLIGINPGAHYGGAKRWSSRRYAAVADALVSKFDARILVFGSPGERRVADEVASCMVHKPLVFAGRTTLGQLMGLIRECSLLITNDSGPMHLAAALAVPQVAIFGSTSDAATGPLSERAVVIKEPVECSPCFLRECPIDFRCMTRITVERVLHAAETILLSLGRRNGGRN